MFQQGDVAALGPWRLTLIGSVGGAEADELVAGWNSANAAAPDGLSYVVATLSVENIGTLDQVIGLSDFLVTGKDGVIRRPPTISIGDQALQGIVAPGGTLTGYVPLLVDDFESCVLWFESTLLGGNWANATFALGPSAEVPTFPTTTSASDHVEGSVDSPAAFGEFIKIGDWEVTLTDIAEGQAVFDIATLGLRALGQSVPEDIQNWLAVYGKIKNVAPVKAYFSPTALLLADESGEPWDHILALTPPPPDLRCYLLPGASHEGWAAFQRTDYGSKGAIYSTAHLIQVRPSALTDTPKYFSVPNASSNNAAGATVEETDHTQLPLQLAVGDKVVTTEDAVNLRAEPSIKGEIVTVLEKGVTLEIVADSVEADGYIWFPVENTDLRYEGFVVQDFIASTS